MAKYWIGVAHRKQALSAKSAGFVALSHGKKSAVSKLSAGDGVIYYAPKTDFEGDAVQGVITLATITGTEIYERNMPDTDFRPWVIDATDEEVSEIPIRPILESLSFVKDIRYWGMAFRRSQFEISEPDFHVLATAMRGQ